MENRKPRNLDGISSLHTLRWLSMGNDFDPVYFTSADEYENFLDSLFLLPTLENKDFMLFNKDGNRVSCENVVADAEDSTETPNIWRVALSLQSFFSKVEYIYIENSRRSEPLADVLERVGLASPWQTYHNRIIDRTLFMRNGDPQDEETAWRKCSLNSF